ncbi:MAG: two-component sensor histidine kinase BarA, partial [Anaerolineales bacterium]|nr:two-component sensor histidine kinase BarA [Anaerolineales bacterium]
KFTIEGRLTLRLNPQERQGIAGIDFEIEDTGIGIAPEHLDRIFQAFTQADPSATRHYEGMGLGLHICQQLCQLMGGEISVESEPGQGAIFRFWLPTELDPVLYSEV